MLLKKYFLKTITVSTSLLMIISVTPNTRYKFLSISSDAVSAESNSSLIDINAVSLNSNNEYVPIMGLYKFSGGVINSSTAPKIPGFIFSKAILKNGSVSTQINSIYQKKVKIGDNYETVNMIVLDSNKKDPSNLFYKNGSKQTACVQFIYIPQDTYFKPNFILNNNNYDLENNSGLITISSDTKYVNKNANYYFTVKAPRGYSITVKNQNGTLTPVSDNSTNEQTELLYSIKAFSASDVKNITVDTSAINNFNININQNSLGQTYQNLLSKPYGDGDGRSNIIWNSFISNTGGFSVKKGGSFTLYILNQGGNLGYNNLIGGLQLVSLKVNNENIGFPKLKFPTFASDKDGGENTLRNLKNKYTKNFNDAVKKEYISKILPIVKSNIGKTEVTEFKSGKNAGLKTTVSILQAYPHAISMYLEPNNNLTQNNFNSAFITDNNNGNTTYKFSKDSTINTLGSYLPLKSYMIYATGVENTLYAGLNSQNYQLSTSDLNDFTPQKSSYNISDNGFGNVMDVFYSITFENINQNIDLSYISTMLTSNVYSFKNNLGVKIMGATDNSNPLTNLWPYWGVNNINKIQFKNGYTSPSLSIDSSDAWVKINSKNNDEITSISANTNNVSSVSIYRPEYQSSGYVKDYVATGLPYLININSKLINVHPILDLNGGTIEGSSDKLIEIGKGYNVYNKKIITLPKSIPKCNKKIFVGWKITLPKESYAFQSNPEYINKLFLPGENIDINKISMNKGNGDILLNSYTGNNISDIDNIKNANIYNAQFKIQAQYIDISNKNGYFPVSTTSIGGINLKPTFYIPGLDNFGVSFDNINNLLTEYSFI